MLLRGSESAREYHIAFANSRYFLGRIDYCARSQEARYRGTVAPAAVSSGGAEWRGAQGDAWACGRSSLGFLTAPVIESGPRGREKLDLGRNVRRAALRSLAHTIEWRAEGGVGVLLLRQGPENAGPAEIARVFKHALCYERKGV